MQEQGCGTERITGRAEAGEYLVKRNGGMDLHEICISEKVVFLGIWLVSQAQANSVLSYQYKKHITELEY